MSVPKGRRKESRFEASHHFYYLRNEVTGLILNDFGFCKEKYQMKIDQLKAANVNNPKSLETIALKQQKLDAFDKWFIDEEARALLDLLRRIEEEFTSGNSIFPSETPARLMEFLVRRWHMNKAIGLCYSLKQEINYVIRTLPVDINKYERFAELIDKQIALYKGVRSADNKLIKPRKDRKTGKILDSMDQHIITIFENIADIIRKIAKVEKSLLVSKEAEVTKQ